MTARDETIEFRILGPFEASEDGQLLEVGAACLVGTGVAAD